MTEATFQFDINVEKFKSFVGKNFTAKQIEDFIAAIFMYVEIVGTEEMNNRIHSMKYDEHTETKMRGIVEMADLFQQFVKKPGQTK